MPVVVVQSANGRTERERVAAQADSTDSSLMAQAIRATLARLNDPENEAGWRPIIVVPGS